MIDELEAATEPKSILAALGSVLSQAEMVAIAGKSDGDVNSVEMWDSRRLVELRSLMLSLSDSSTTRGVAQWLRTGNRLLGGRRPIDALCGGDLRRVREAAASFIEGSYT